MQIQKSFVVVLSSLAFIPATAGFALQDVRTTQRIASALEASRRDFVERAAFLPAAMALGISFEAANASGGATAGGAYLLSAKQRYNERVKEAVRGLLASEKSLASGDSKEAKAYFASEEAGSWKDLTAAGYLLSNAFRRNSSAAPDSLPSVKVSLRTNFSVSASVSS